MAKQEPKQQTQVQPEPALVVTQAIETVLQSVNEAFMRLQEGQDKVIRQNQAIQENIILLLVEVRGKQRRRFRAFLKKRSVRAQMRPPQWASRPTRRKRWIGRLKRLLKRQ